MERPWDKIHRELNLVAPDYHHITPAACVDMHGRTAGAHPALFFGDQSLSYAELREWSAKFAALLSAEDFSAGDIVAVHLPNIPAYPIAMLGTSWLGGITSGVSTLLTASELKYQLGNLGAKFIVTSRQMFADRLSAILTDLPDLKIVIVVDDPFTLSSFEMVGLQVQQGKRIINFSNLNGMPPWVEQPAQMDPDDVLFIQYTGGTTGPSKGAMLSVQNVMHNAQYYSSVHNLQYHRECIATAFPLYHMGGMAIYLLVVYYGAAFTLVPNPRDVESFCDMMQRHPPTFLAAVPTLYQMLIEHRDFKKIDFTHLKAAACGAAPFTVQGKKQLDKIIGPNKLSDHFGMTETGPVYICNPKQRLKHASVGIPLPGMDVKIVDIETGTQDQPLGEAGEIITSGAHVMQGYWKNPEGTANALRSFQGRTWMYTGDVGYMDEEGYVYLCDRAKDMAVVGGYKVFSVEVEDKLKALPIISLSALVATPNPERFGSDILHLFVQVTPDARLRPKAELQEEILKFCRQEMAPYKVPKHIHIVDQIPLTSIGKIDKKLLRQNLVG